MTSLEEVEARGSRLCTVRGVLPEASFLGEKEKIMDGIVEGGTGMPPPQPRNKDEQAKFQWLNVVGRGKSPKPKVSNDQEKNLDMEEPDEVTVNIEK